MLAIPLHTNPPHRILLNTKQISTTHDLPPLLSCRQLDPATKSSLPSTLACCQVHPAIKSSLPSPLSLLRTYPAVESSCVEPSSNDFLSIFHFSEAPSKSTPPTSASSSTGVKPSLPSSPSRHHLYHSIDSIRLQVFPAVEPLSQNVLSIFHFSKTPSKSTTPRRVSHYYRQSLSNKLVDLLSYSRRHHPNIHHYTRQP